MKFFRSVLASLVASAAFSVLFVAPPVPAMAQCGCIQVSLPEYTTVWVPVFVGGIWISVPIVVQTN